MARSTGYKYRTLSTNTGEKKRRDSVEDNTFDRKIKELRNVMHSKIQNEVDQMGDARDAIHEKFKKIDSKIDSMIELQSTVLGLRDNLRHAEAALVLMLEKVNKIEISVGQTELCSFHSRKSSYRSQQPTVLEENELFQSNIINII